MSERACAFDGCDRTAKKRGYCGAHYQQLQRGRPLTPLLGPGGAYRAPETVHRPNWTPPRELSADWRAKNAARAITRMPRDPGPCARNGCGGEAVRGSDLCVAHKCYAEAQERLKARGLA